MRTPELERTIGHKAYTPDGHKIGKVRGVYVDDYTEEPNFVTVETGLFGGKESFVPVREARIDDDDQLVLPYDKDTVKDAPHAEVDEHLSLEEERKLFDYYGIPFPERPGAATETDRPVLRKHVVVEEPAGGAPVREERVAGQETVTDDVRVERIDTDDDRRR